MNRTQRIGSTQAPERQGIDERVEESERVAESRTARRVMRMLQRRDIFTNKGIKVGQPEDCVLRTRISSRVLSLLFSLTGATSWPFILLRLRSFRKVSHRTSKNHCKRVRVSGLVVWGAAVDHHP